MITLYKAHNPQTGRFKDKKWVPGVPYNNERKKKLSENGRRKGSNVSNKLNRKIPLIYNEEFLITKLSSYILDIFYKNHM